MKTRRRLRTADKLILVLAPLQILFAAIVLYDELTSILGFRHEPLPWDVKEAIQIAAGLALLIGMIIGVVLIMRVRKQIATADSRLRAATDAFQGLIEEEFDRWNLTPAEREVALLVLKGLTNAEISAVTGKAEGTVKAQCTAVFRKAGVTSRGQFASAFIEVLMQEPLDAENSRSSA